MNGFLGMMIFSGSLPATRVAVLELDPLFLTAVRAAIAALLALCALLITRQARPTRADLPPLLFVALGVVIGFPLLTALALQHTTSAHSLVYIGLLPLATAGFGVLRGGERPKPAFGLFRRRRRAGGRFRVEPWAAVRQGDALMVGAVLLCGPGYAEGAVLSRRIGGWQVISRALVVALPLTLAATAGGTGRLACDQRRRPAVAGLRLGVQHVDWVYFLVSRLGAGRHRRRRTVAAAAAVLRPGAGGLAAA